MKKLFLLSLLTLSSRSFGEDYFSKPIDYWSQSREAQEKKERETKPTPPPAAQEKKEQLSYTPFEWKKYADPKNDEFFKEGDYTPPKPFMEVARNPSDENIKRWFEMIETKNLLLRNLQDKISDYLKKSGSSLSAEEGMLLEQKKSNLEPTGLDIKRFRFRLYFDSSCPHCKEMMSTLKELQDLGFYAEVRQVDKNQPPFPVPFPIIPATTEEIREKNIISWPVLFVADVGKQLVYRINGYFPTKEVLATLAKK